MDNIELERANKLHEEIQKIKYITSVIKNTINKAKCKTRYPYERLFRFINVSRKESDPKKATVILFDGLDFRGTDIPVDIELLECLQEFFDKKLENKQSEFESIGKG